MHALWFCLLLSPIWAQRSGSLGYRLDIQRMDFFHTLSFQKTFQGFGLDAYAGLGQRNTFSGATFFPQVGVQAQGFPLGTKPGFFQGFQLHADVAWAYLAKPFLLHYSRLQLGYGFFWPLTKVASCGQLRLTHQAGIAGNLEVQQHMAQRHRFLDYRFSLGLYYVLPN